MRERREQRLAADLLGDADPGVVRLAEGREARILLDRQREVPAADQDVLVQLLDPVEVEVALLPVAAERREQRLLVVVVVRKGRADRGDRRLRIADERRWRRRARPLPQPPAGAVALIDAASPRVRRASRARAKAATRSTTRAPFASCQNGATGRRVRPATASTRSGPRKVQAAAPAASPSSHQRGVRPQSSRKRARSASPSNAQVASRMVAGSPSGRATPRAASGARSGASPKSSSAAAPRAKTSSRRGAARRRKRGKRSP